MQIPITHLGESERHDRRYMRFVDFRERALPISRYSDPSVPSGGLDTSIVALTTDVVRDRKRIVGYGFSSIGRFAQSGLIRERFAPRLMHATDADLASDDGANLDPFKAWSVMMKGEKPGGHGERCVAVGTLDMAIWDASAKIAGVPLFRFLAAKLTSEFVTAPGSGVRERRLLVSLRRWSASRRGNPCAGCTRLRGCQDQDRCGSRSSKICGASRSRRRSCRQAGGSPSTR